MRGEEQRVYQLQEYEREDELIIYKALFQSTKDLNVLAEHIDRLIESFSSQKFPLQLQQLISHLPLINSQQQAITVVSHRIAKWTLYIQLLTKLLRQTSKDQMCFERILCCLNRNHFANVINQLMRIDEVIQLKSKGEKDEVGGGLMMIGDLEVVVVCKYRNFNQSINLLKKHVIKAINIILENTQQDDKLQSSYPELLDTLNPIFYSHLLSDLSILSRHFLYFKQSNYLNYGQYSLIKQFYQLLDISLEVPILQKRLISTIQQQTLGWPCFLFYVCMINMGQFQYQRSEQNKEFGEQSVNVRENRKNEVFVSSLLESVIVNSNDQQSKDKVITLAAQISGYLIEQSSQTLRKTLRDFGIESNPMLQQYLQNPEHIGVWLHIIGLMVFQSKSLTNIPLLRLLQKSSDQLAFFKIQMLKSFLSLYLNVSKNECAIVEKIVEKIVALLIHCPLEDKRAQILFTFLIKFMSRGQFFFRILAKHNQQLFDYCFRSICSYFVMKEQLHLSDRSFKICIDFIVEFIENSGLSQQIWVSQQNAGTVGDLFNVLTKDYQLLSQDGRLSVSQLINSILAHLGATQQGEVPQRVIGKHLMQMIHAIVAFMMKSPQLNLQYFDNLKMLIKYFAGHIDSNLINRALSLLPCIQHNQMQLQISSEMLKSIVQTLILQVLYKKFFFFDDQLWQDACIYVLTQRKNKEKQAQSSEKQEKLRSSQKKVAVKNRLRLQIQAFKLTTFLLSSHHKKLSQNNNQNSSPNSAFLSNLHNEVSLTKQLSSFEQFLTFGDICVICYGIEEYIPFLSFEQRRGFVVRMSVLISQLRMKKRKSMKIDSDDIAILPLNEFNPIIAIRSRMFTLLPEIQHLIQGQTNQQLKQQHQRYHIAVRLLLQQLQSITIVQNEKRKILKVIVSECEQLPTSRHDGQFTI